jgi:aminoglycoside phosphotransferase (APT) family kinase protein
MTEPTVHPDRPVRRDFLDGRPIIVKSYAAADPAEIWKSMAALWASPFGHEFHFMPEPINLMAPCVTMEFISGDPLGARGDLGVTPTRLGDIADLLVRFHSSGVEVERNRTAGKLVRSLRRKQAEMSDDLAAHYADAVSLIAAWPPVAELPVVNHGDFSPRNLLDAGDRLVLIDFDRLQMAGPGRDVGYLAAWCWVTQLQIDGRGSWSIGDAFSSEYATRGGYPIADDASRFHRACGLLRIAQSWSALADRPDLVRAIIDEATRQVTT